MFTFFDIIEYFYKNDLVFEGIVKLVSANVYDARRYDNYLVSTFFIMYAIDSKQEVLNGNFVIEMKDDKIVKIYMN